MVKVVGVRFRTAGKIYFFDPGRLQIKKGDHVIVETARGIEYGAVVGDPREIEEEKVVQPLKQVLRIATERDREQEEENRQKEKEAFQICLEKIRKHGLEMKLIDVEYTFDNNKVLFYFTADGRIDFRELVKDLASVFKTRIELRQIGVRDETKTVGGIGICGRVLCCHSYLSDFIPVSIKMAKEQNLSLNPAKISGVCGRLMCCLKHEEDTYEELNRRLPNVGDFVTTEDGLKGEVHSVNVLRQTVKVVVETNDEKEIKEYDVNKLKFRKKHGKKDKAETGRDELSADVLSREELKELELLEKEEDQEIAEREEKTDQDERQAAREKGEKRERRGRSRGAQGSQGKKGERPEKEAAPGNSGRGSEERIAEGRGAEDRKSESRKVEDRRERRSRNSEKPQPDMGGAQKAGVPSENNVGLMGEKAGAYEHDAADAHGKDQGGHGAGKRNDRNGRNRNKKKNLSENGSSGEQKKRQDAAKETEEPKTENHSRKEHRRRPSRQRRGNREQPKETGGTSES